MTSKKGAKEETKKNHKFGQTRSKTKAFQLKGFYNFFFGRGEGVRGDLAQAVRGWSRELRQNPWRETSSAFFENRGF